MDLVDRIYYKAARENIPIAVHIDLTYHCGQKCVHCYIPEEWRRGKGPDPELGTNQFKSIIKQLAEKGTLFLCFSGGEIFLRQDLMELIRYARELNFSIFLLTNGIIGPSKEQASLLDCWGINGMAVSLYSMDPMVHDRITQTPGSWNKVMGTIDLCQERGLPLALNSTALKMNEFALPGLQAFCKAKGIPLRHSANLRPRWDGKTFPPDLALHDHPTFQGPGNGKEGSTSSGAGEGEKACSAGLNICYINPSGDLWPCPAMPLPCGRFNMNNSIADIWERSPTLNQFRQLMMTGWEAPGKICEVMQNCEICVLGGFNK